VKSVSTSTVTSESAPAEIKEVEVGVLTVGQELDTRGDRPEDPGNGSREFTRTLVKS
jgi:hypothetical protein